MPGGRGDGGENSMRPIRMLVAGACTSLALTLPGVAGAAPAAALAHGLAAARGQFPFAAKLVMTGIPSPSGPYDSACSGALISSTWLITAGHCFHDIHRNRVSGPVPYPTTATLDTVVTGPSETGAVTRSVDTVQQSPTADIAVAHLTGSTTVAPLHLSSARPHEGQVLTLAGWGATSSVEPTPSSRLYWGQVKVTGFAPTTVSVVGYRPSPDTSACRYDSGAPYFLARRGSTPLLVSTESTGPDCPHTSPETTARVDTQIGWIRTVVRDLP